MQPAIQFRLVSKDFQRTSTDVVRAVRDIDLGVEDGEIVCVLGPSGCGKSTLLNLVAGFISASSGTIEIHGRVVDGPHNRCGIAFQGDAVFPWMTVAANVEYPLRWNGTPIAERPSLVQRHLQRVGLSDVAGHWPRELSGGMRKRVDLARAFALNAPILLLDEPFGSLDVLTKDEMQSLLLEIWRADRKTILFVTHDVEEAILLGHRVAVMSKSPGRIHRVIPVPFPRDSRRTELKLSSEFVALRRTILDLLSRNSAPDAAKEGD